MIIDETDYLEHFGVKGMKWGVRNEDASPRVQARRERKAEKFDVRSKMLQTKISEVRSAQATSGVVKSKVLGLQERRLQGENRQALRNAEAKRQGKLSSGQKKAIAGAVIVAAALAAYGTRSMLDSGEMNSKVMKGKAFLNGDRKALVKGNTSIFKTNPKLADPNMSFDDINSLSAAVNPGYAQGREGTRNNCRRATYAFEMRRRGYDVRATSTDRATGQGARGVANVLSSPDEKLTPATLPGYIGKILKETVVKPSGGKETLAKRMDAVGTLGKNKIDAGEEGFEKSIFAALRSQPDRARGELALTWNNGSGGHSAAYEIINGAPVVFDAQTGRVYGGPKSFAKDFGNRISDAGFTRLDDQPLNTDFLSRWVKNAA